MQGDVTDGGGWLTSKGVTDPRRICIYGGSYGGYAALAGVTFMPDLYACAVQIINALRKRGVNVEYMVKENEGHGSHNQENRFDFYAAMDRSLKAHL